jgi:phosphoglycolate phosphatase
MGGPAAVLLDLDGTLTDPGVGIERSLRHALAALGREPTRVDLARAVGPPLREVLREYLAGAAEAAVEEAVRRYRERYGRVGLFESAVYPGVVELLEGIRGRGWCAVVVTSKLESTAARVVDHFGLSASLSGVVGCRDGELGRKEDLVARALQRGAIPRDAAVVVGDRRHDVRGARACGLAAIGVTWGYGTREELERAGAAWICETPAAVLCALERRFGGP